MSSIQALPAVLASCQAGQSSRTRALQERFNTRVLLMVAQIPSSVAVPPPHPTSVAREALVPSTSHPLATLPPAHLGTRSSGENLASALATFIRHSPARCLEQRLAQVCAERRDPAGPTSSAASLSLTLPSSPVPRVATVRRATPPASSPSQHVGLFRAAMLVAGALSSVWKEGQVLVDSGSQQAPLLSHDFAAAVVGGRGPLAALAAQADGSLLKLYSLPPVDLCVNGKPQRVRWPAADIAPYDCILGESWLYANAGVLDYKANQLWTSTASGLVPLDLGRRPAAPLLDVPGFAVAQQQCAEADSVRRVTALVEAASAPPSPPPGCSARQRRLARRHAEALAVQLALAAWRPLLYGEPFELHSDHFSLTSLLTQRAAPSQRILRLCEFLADFNFEEVRYVRGVDNVVPDFLSRPWDPAQPDVNSPSTGASPCA